MISDQNVILPQSNADLHDEGAPVNLLAEMRRRMKPTIGPDGEWMEIPAHWIDGDHPYTVASQCDFDTIPNNLEPAE